MFTLHEIKTLIEALEMLIDKYGERPDRVALLNQLEGRKAATESDRY